MQQMDLRINQVKQREQLDAARNPSSMLMATDCRQVEATNTRNYQIAIIAELKFSKSGRSVWHMRTTAVGHNLDFPETDSDLACTKDVFLTTYILACALLITFQTSPALLAILSKKSCVICGLSFCVGSTEFDEPSLTNTFSRNKKRRSVLSCIPLCRSEFFFLVPKVMLTKCFRLG